MCNINIKKKHLPGSIKAFIVRCYEDADWFTIFINASLSQQAQLETLRHELKHIKNNDFSSELTATEIEDYEHK